MSSVAKFFGACRDDEVEIAAYKGRSFRVNDAKLFKKYYKYYDDVSESRTCIWSDDMCTWDDKSSGIMWVGVCGKDTMCVVTMTGDVDLSRACYGLSNCTNDTVLHNFRKTVISEMDDLKSTIYQRTGKSIKMPFGVVSVTPSPPTDEKAVKERGLEAEKRHKASKPFLNFCMSTKVAHHYFLEKRNAFTFYRDEFMSAKLVEVEFDDKESMQHEESRKRLISTMEKMIQAKSDFAEYDEQMAIEFLKKEMKEKSIKGMSVDETIKIAISAFQHLLKREFKANEIEVSYIDPNYKISRRLHNRNPNYNLKVLGIEAIQKHVAIINNNGPSKEAKKLRKEDNVEPIPLKSINNEPSKEDMKLRKEDNVEPIPLKSIKGPEGVYLGNLDDEVRDASDISGCHIPWDEVVAGCDLSYLIPKKDAPEPDTAETMGDRDGALKEDFTCELVYLGDLDDLLRDVPDISDCYVPWEEVVAGCDLSYLSRKKDAPEPDAAAADKGRSKRKHDAVPICSKSHCKYDMSRVVGIPICEEEEEEEEEKL